MPRLFSAHGHSLCGLLYSPTSPVEAAGPVLLSLSHLLSTALTCQAFGHIRTIFSPSQQSDLDSPVGPCPCLSCCWAAAHQDPSDEPGWPLGYCPSLLVSPLQSLDSAHQHLPDAAPHLALSSWAPVAGHAYPFPLPLSSLKACHRPLSPLSIPGTPGSS